MRLPDRPASTDPAASPAFLVALLDSAPAERWPVAAASERTAAPLDGSAPARAAPALATEESCHPFSPAGPEPLAFALSADAAAGAAVKNN